jgi:hypothetical protein
MEPTVVRTFRLVTLAGSEGDDDHAIGLDTDCAVNCVTPRS